ncbi:SGNH/GDSL hydrolase family protein [Leifsonia bigeumensis]|uniref:SGNH/GDSL hydrolase family protein n=1 Tax=Leifsonella bigeumensis TaxID=433643 RepID=A0ABP7F6H9_9MICO
MATSLHDTEPAPPMDVAHWPILKTTQGEFAVEGADHVEQTDSGLVFHRLPESAIAKIPMEFFRVVEAQPSGVRLVMATRATTIRLVVTTTAAVFFPDEPVESFGRFDLLVDGRPCSHLVVPSGGIRTMEVLTNSSTVSPGVPVTVDFEGLPGRDKTVEIWLPHDVEVAVASVDANAPLAAVRDARPIWLNYGSSISHGVNASAPTGIWAAVAATAAGRNLLSMGFSGNALLDSLVATTIRDREADLISLEIGINVINHDGFRVRTFLSAVTAFLDTIRERHTTTPIWVVSAILCPVVEDRPGPTMMVGLPGARRAETESQPHDLQRGRLSLSLTRELLQQIVEWRSRTDSNLHYLDGRELYGEAESESMPMRDGLHPDSAAQRHIGLRFAELVLGATVTDTTLAKRSN